MTTTKIVRYVLSGFFALFAVIVGLSSWMSRDAGFNIVVQDTLFGSYRVYDETGVNFKVPFFTKVTRYKQVATINFGNDANDTGKFTRNRNSIDVTFADTYYGSIPATFRFRMSRDPEKILELHKEFRSFENLVDSLLVKNAMNVTVITGTQYTGEEFFQGGLNAFKVKLEDQLRNGLYQTKRKKVQVEVVDSVPMSSENNDVNATKQQKQMVMKDVIITDANGNELRLSNPLEEYGIVVTQVTVGRPTPEDRLDQLLITKKKLVAQRISAEQQIITNKAEAKAEIQKQEIEKQKAIQIAQKNKELGVIEKQKEVEMERQQAYKELVEQNKLKDVAVVQKQKELEVAEANRGIQEANAEAALFQAKAITATGLAEAEVDRAKLAAKQSAKDIYMAELQRDIAQVMYRNLAKFKVEMPRNVIMGADGAGELPSNLSALTAYGVLGTMDLAGKAAGKQQTIPAK